MQRFAARVITTLALFAIWPVLMVCTLIGISGLVAQAMWREWSA